MRTRIGVGLAIVALGVAMLPSALAAGGGKPSPTNADSGLTEAQVVQRQSDARASFESRLGDWYKNLNLASLDLLALPRAERLVTLPVPASSFSEAVSAARIVVTGLVVSIVPGEAGTVVRVSVDKVLKGSVAGLSVTFTQLSTIRPTQDWSGAFIAESPGSALLIPGSMGEFLLGVDSDGQLALQEATGSYLYVSGRVTPSASNPFGAQVQDMTPDALTQATANLVP